MAGALLATDGGGRRQEAETWQTLDVALYMMGVAHLDAHHLVAATDAEHRGALPMCLNDGLRHPVATQLVEIVDGRLRPRQDDDVGLLDLLYVITII